MNKRLYPFLDTYTSYDALDVLNIKVSGLAHRHYLINIKEKYVNLY